MRSVILAILATALAASAILAPQTVDAQTYRWCAVYGLADDARNCGFTTLGQCRATVSGIGGYCEENPLLNGSGESPARKKKRSNG